MALSNSTDFSITRDQLITGALRIVGAIAQGETPNATQLSEGSEALNMLVKAWQADGMPIWVTKEYVLDMTANTNTYTPTTKLLKVIQAWNRNSTSKVDIPMRIITRDEYNRLGNKSTTGNPIQVYHEPGLTTSTVKLFPTPAAIDASASKIYLVYQKEYDDFDVGTNNPEFPHEYFDALKFGLANRLSFEYGVEPNDRKQLLEQAMLLRADALSFGTEEGSMFFQVDKRNY